MIQEVTLFQKPKLLAQAVMLQHTLFSLPFALAALLQETGGNIPWNRVLWITLAILGARNAANGLNRLIDHKIDARNPRTKNRHLPNGLLERKDLWIFTGVCLLVFVFSTAMLGLMCLLLLPLAIALLILYSYTKRFTWLCHFFLGSVVAIAPMGTLIALTGTIALRFFPVTIAVALWVAGFDIIYACQDFDFDQKEKLFSIPARWGVRRALHISTITHILAFISFTITGFFYPFSFISVIGMGLIGVLLVIEHVIVAPGALKHIDTASYHINEIVGALYLFTNILEVFSA